MEYGKRLTKVRLYIVHHFTGNSIFKDLTWKEEALLGKIKIAILKVKSCETSVSLGKYTETS